MAAEKMEQEDSNQAFGGMDGQQENIENGGFKMEQKEIQEIFDFLESKDIDKDFIQQLQQLSPDDFQKIIQQPNILQALLENHIERDLLEVNDENQLQPEDPSPGS